MPFVDVERGSIYDPQSCAVIVNELDNARVHLKGCEVDAQSDNVQQVTAAKIAHFQGLATNVFGVVEPEGECPYCSDPGQSVRSGSTEIDGVVFLNSQ